MHGSVRFGPGTLRLSLRKNKDIAYVVPKEGGTIWADTLAIPKGAKHKDLAEKFINYLLDPKVSVKKITSRSAIAIQMKKSIPAS
ncbi:hypothetical protein GCM10020331_073130 [Ectobacillus funiculus]